MIKNLTIILAICSLSFFSSSCKEQDDPMEPVNEQVIIGHSDGFGVFLSVDEEENQWYSTFTTSFKSIEDVFQDKNIDPNTLVSLKMSKLRMYKNNQSNPDIISEPLLFSKVEVYLNDGTNDLLVASHDNIDSEDLYLNVEDEELKNFHTTGPFRYKVRFELKERKAKVNSIAFTANYTIITQ